MNRKQLYSPLPWTFSDIEHFKAGDTIRFHFFVKFTCKEDHWILRKIFRKRIELMIKAYIYSILDGFDDL